MAYCEADDVKLVLQIAEDDSTFDDELEGCIASADAYIDMRLEPYDLSVPGSVPQNIKDASIHFAAWLFRKRRNATGSDAFKAEAEEFLSAYLESESEIAFKVVSDE